MFSADSSKPLMIVKYFQNVCDDEKFFLLFINKKRDGMEERNVQYTVYKESLTSYLPKPMDSPIIFVRNFGRAVVNASVNEGYKP
jgi:hypothetical protein